MGGHASEMEAREVNGVRIIRVRDVVQIVVIVNGEGLPITTREPTYRQMTYPQAQRILRGEITQQKKAGTCASAN